MNGGFSDNVPIYIQLIDAVQMRVFSGQWREGQRIPPVRELAIEFGVNPNTMQKSLTELERIGLLHTETTNGRFVTTDRSVIDRLRSDLALGMAADFYARMLAIGYGMPQIEAALRDAGKPIPAPADLPQA